MKTRSEGGFLGAHLFHVTKIVPVAARGAPASATLRFAPGHAFGVTIYALSRSVASTEAPGSGSSTVRPA
jgi:hypothetical protein